LGVPPRRRVCAPEGTKKRGNGLMGNPAITDNGSTRLTAVGKRGLGGEKELGPMVKVNAEAPNEIGERHRSRRRGRSARIEGNKVHSLSCPWGGGSRFRVEGEGGNENSEKRERKTGRLVKKKERLRRA